MHEDSKRETTVSNETQITGAGTESAWDNRDRRSSSRHQNRLA